MSYLPHEELIDRLDLEFDLRLRSPERIDRQDLLAVYEALVSLQRQIPRWVVRRAEA